MLYRTCPQCGAHLDTYERCECEMKREVSTDRKTSGEQCSPLRARVVKKTRGAASAEVRDRLTELERYMMTQ